MSTNTSHLSAPVSVDDASITKVYPR
jgi:hypothetical protein